MHNYDNVDYLNKADTKVMAQATLPVGYILVTEGQSQAGDLPFYGENLVWSEMPIAENEANLLNLPVEEFWALARKQAS